MAEEGPQVQSENKFLLEIADFVGSDPEASFIPLLTNSIQKIIQEATKKDILKHIQEQIAPVLRNIEVTSALQVSKSNENYSELKKVTEHLSLQLTKNNEYFNLIKNNLAAQSEKVENVQKLVVKKADLYELQAFAREVSSMTPLNTFYSFQEWTKSLAAKTEVEEVRRELGKTKEILDDKPSYEYVHNENSKIVVEAKSELNKEKGILMRKLGKVKESQGQSHEKIEMANNKIKQSGEILSKKISEVLESITQKPWMGDLSSITEELHKKVPRSEFDEILTTLNPKLENLLKRSQDIERDLKEYTEVLARFDEVILTKSSKEDIKVIHQMLGSFVKKQDIDPVLAEFSDKFVNIGTKLLANTKKVEDVNKEITNYAAVSALLKTQTKDYGKIMDSLKNINETLRFKADKADIHGIFDIVGYRDDVMELNSGLEKLKELFTQSVMLQHEAIGTFIPSVDPQMTKNRLRTEIGKNLDIIIKRLNSHSKKTEGFSSKTRESKKRLKNLTIINPDVQTEDRAMTTRNHSTNHKRIFSAAGHKRFL